MRVTFPQNLGKWFMWKWKPFTWWLFLHDSPTPLPQKPLDIRFNLNHRGGIFKLHQKTNVQNQEKQLQVCNGSFKKVQVP